MTSAINASTQVTLPKVTAMTAPKAPPVRVDSDGDHDASGPSEVQLPKATSGSIGTQINTTA